MTGHWQGLLSAAIIILIFAALFYHGIVRMETARRWIERGAVLLDVDTGGELAVRHPRVAMSVALEDLPRRAHELGPPETFIVVYANSWWRGAKAVHDLRGMGFWNLQNAAGRGTNATLRKSATREEARRQNEDRPQLA